MRHEIIIYLESNRTFEAGVKLYNRFGKNNQLKRKFNMQGETDKNLELLHYQLFKLSGITEPEFKMLLSKEIKGFIPKPAELVETEPAETESVKIAEATRNRIRSEFPFLSDKNCPDDLKILVADMITAYESYIAAHTELFDVKDEKEAFEAADKVIENYLDNRAIWDELNHYKVNGKILGKHKHFEAMKRKEELMNKSVPELIKLKEQLEMNIWRNKKKMDDDPKPHLIKQRQERIAGYETDLKIVKSLLNINE